MPGTNLLDSFLNRIIDKKTNADNKHQEWYGLTSDEREKYRQQAHNRLLDMEQTTLNVLAAQHFEMQNNPESVGHQLTLLETALDEVRKRIAGQGSTPAREDYKRQLENTIVIYQHQRTIQGVYASRWSRAVQIINDGTDTVNDAALAADAAQKTKKLEDEILHFNKELNKPNARKDMSNFVKLTAKQAAYKDLKDKYEKFIKAYRLYVNPGNLPNNSKSVEKQLTSLETKPDLKETYEESWRKAVQIINDGTDTVNDAALAADAAQKTKKLEDEILRFNKELNKPNTRTDMGNFVKLTAERAAYKDLKDKYEKFIEAYHLYGNPGNLPNNPESIKQQLTSLETKPDLKKTYNSSWFEAVQIIDGSTNTENYAELAADAAQKTKKLEDEILRFNQELNKPDARTDMGNFIELTAKQAAYLHLKDEYNKLVNSLVDPRTLPASSDDLPINVSLLLIEERPGYIRMNISLLEANYDRTQKEIFMRDGRLVVQPRKQGGDINLSFGTASRSLAWHQIYRLNPQQPGTPTYAPIRSVLVKTQFVRDYFSTFMESEHSQRHALIVKTSGDSTEIKLVGVDRKVPNQIGVTVDPGGSFEDLINRNADLSSFQTIAPPGYKDTLYDPDRDGSFMDIDKLAQSVGFGERQYLLELVSQQADKPTEYLPATPTIKIYKDKGKGKFTAKHLGVRDIEKLYKYNSALFEKIGQLRDGSAKNERWYKLKGDEYQKFENAFIRLLDRNHITPADILADSDANREGRRDIVGNSFNKMAWERSFANDYLNNSDVVETLLSLSAEFKTKIKVKDEDNDEEKKAKTSRVSLLLKNGYVLSDLGAARQAMPQLYNACLEKAETDARNPTGNQSSAQYNQGNVIDNSNRIMLFTLLGGVDSTKQSFADGQLPQTIETEFSGTAVKQLRMQLLFHALRPIAEGLQSNPSSPPGKEPTNQHSFTADGDKQDQVQISNRIAQPDAYQILNTRSEQVTYFDDSHIIRDDKQRSYNQYRPKDGPITDYMQALDTPFIGGISGTTRVVTSHLDALFGPLSLKQYWQFQLANAALMIRNGYHSFFETLYVAARFENDTGQSMLALFDGLKAQGEQGVPLKGQLYTNVMNLLLPVVNEGIDDAAKQFIAPAYAGVTRSVFDPALERLGERAVQPRSINTLSARIDLVKEVYQRLTPRLRTDSAIRIPGFEPISTTELDSLDLTTIRQHLQEQMEQIIQDLEQSGHTFPDNLSDGVKTSIARLAVEGIVGQDVAKKAELLLKLESSGFSFKPKNDTDRLLTFWSGEYQDYERVLNTKRSEQGQPSIATFSDVTAIYFAFKLGDKISKYIKENNSGNNEEGRLLIRAGEQGFINNIAFLSSVYAASTADLGGTVYTMSAGGIKVKNYFWNVELPVLRALQKRDGIGEIRILHEPYNVYETKPLVDIGSLLTAADVNVLAHYNNVLQPLRDDGFASMHKQWIDEQVKPTLIQLHQALQNYIDRHSDSRRVPGIKEALELANQKLIELNGFDAMSSSARVTAARENPAGRTQLWNVSIFTQKVYVRLKPRGESYYQILSLLEQSARYTGPSAFRFPDTPGENPFITLKFQGDVIDKYADQFKRLLPYQLLREIWHVRVTKDSDSVTLKTEGGHEARLKVEATENEKLKWQKQIRTLERFLLANFSADTMPLQLELTGDKIKSGDSILAERTGQDWLSNQASIAEATRLERIGSHTSDIALYNMNVETWPKPIVSPHYDGGDSRYAAQIIIQVEDNSVVLGAAANLAAKHSESSVIIQLDAEGKYRVVYGDVALLCRNDSGVLPTLRWQVVGHGRTGIDGSRTMGGLSAQDLALHLGTLMEKLVSQDGVEAFPLRISLVGCSMESDIAQAGFGGSFVSQLQAPNTEVSVRTADLAVDSGGRKYTIEGKKWLNKAPENKRVFIWQEETGITTRYERVKGRLLIGGNEVDIGELLTAIRVKTLSATDLNPGEHYALSQFFPDQDGRLSWNKLQATMASSLEYAKLKNDIARLRILLPVGHGDANLNRLGGQALVNELENNWASLRQSGVVGLRQVFSWQNPYARLLLFQLIKDLAAQLKHNRRRASKSRSTFQN